MPRRFLCSILIGGVLALLLLMAAPAQACGCGVYIPREGEGNVVQERALIRWDGTTEDVVMALGVQGDATEAAWILPVPSQASVQLGEAALFETLAELTKPRVEYRYGLFPPEAMPGGSDGAAVGAGAPVTLLQQQTLGPFEVSTLAATDATALSNWLADNGYTFPPGLAEVLQAYVDQGWYYVAVRLTPGTTGEALTGELDPLWVTFQTDRMVYPMRATALATNGLPVFLYVLADHRVDKLREFGDSRASFADWVEPASLPAGSPLAPFVDRRLFLTKFEEHIWNPTQVKDDYFFSYAEQDTIYHDMEVEYIYDIGGIPIYLLVFGLPCLIILGLGAGLAWFLVARQRRRPAYQG